MSEVEVIRMVVEEPLGRSDYKLQRFILTMGDPDGEMLTELKTEKLLLLILLITIIF